MAYGFKDYLLCAGSSEEYKRKLSRKCSKCKKSSKQISLLKEKDKINDSILDEDDNFGWIVFTISSHLLVIWSKQPAIGNNFISAEEN